MRGNRNDSAQNLFGKLLTFLVGSIAGRGRQGSPTWIVNQLSWLITVPVCCAGIWTAVPPQTSLKWTHLKGWQK